MAKLTRAQQKRATIPGVPTTGRDDDPAFRTGSEDKPATVNGISGRVLLAFIERVEHVNSEVAALREDAKLIKAEAKGAGFDTKVLNYLIKLRAQDRDEREEFEALADAYKRAIGMLG